MPKLGTSLGDNLKHLKKMEDFLVFDLETQRSAQDVGGWRNIAEMKMSVGVLWDSREAEFISYFEGQVMELIEHLQSGPRVVGFNHISFDYTVLSGYFSMGAERKKAMGRLKALDNLDLLVDIANRLGHRLKLDSIVRPTLGAGKSANGLDALKWYQQYLAGDEKKLGMIEKYCRQDVQVTKDLYLHGLEQGEVQYEDKFAGIKSLSVDWRGDEPESEESVQLSF